MKTATSTTIYLSSDPVEFSAYPGAEVLQLIYAGSEDAQDLTPDRYESAVVQPLMTAFAAVQHHWEWITAAQRHGRVIVVAPATAALGDPDKPLDAAVVGGLLSFVRSLAIELQRCGATAHILFFDEAPSDPAMLAMTAALVDATSNTVTGQEIYLAGGSTLGKLHP